MPPLGKQNKDRNNPSNWKFKCRLDGWYLVGIPLDCEPTGEYGPAKTYEEIKELKAGLIRFLEDHAVARSNENLGD